LVMVLFLKQILESLDDLNIRENIHNRPYF
jgi:hypothetical protein